MKSLFLFALAFLIFCGAFSQKLVSSEQALWTDSAWHSTHNNMFTYDNSGYKINWLHQGWDTLSTSWHTLSQTIYTNDNSGKVVNEVDQFWGGGQGYWYNSSRTSYTYHSTGKIESRNRQHWTNNNWENSVSDTFSYDSGANLTLYESKFWNSSHNNWDNRYQSLYTNNPNGTVQDIVGQMWDTASSSWLTHNQSFYSYNSSNELDTIIYGGIYNGIWYKGYKWSYSYDNGGYVSNILGQNWDGNAWINSVQTDYINSPTGEVLQEVIQQWNDTSNVWENLFRMRYYYSILGTGNSASLNKYISLYPNPVSGTLNIKAVDGFTAAMTIVDSQGRTVYLQQNEQPLSSVDVSKLSPGLYFIKFKSGTTVYNSRFLKE